MTKKERKKINDAIVDLETAAVNASWAGAQDPCDREWIYRQLTNARHHLHCLLNAHTDGE